MISMPNYFIKGPALGAFLFSLGGFPLPFATVGSIGFIIATLLLVVIPNVMPEPRKPSEKSLKLKNVFQVRIGNNSQFHGLTKYFFFQKYFPVHERSAVKNSFSTPDGIF